MNKYIVVRQSPTESLDADFDMETSAVTLCGTVAEVVEQLQRINRVGDDWSVWEVVGNKTEQRAVCYPYDKERAIIQ